MKDTPTKAYLLCGTPRTGSTLLCALLESTRVAGRPESYFRKADVDAWVTTWGIPRAPNGSFTFADFLRGAINAGRSDNGVFAARIMWGTMEEVIGNFRELYADQASSERELLTQAFGYTRFIYLRRRDVVAQAVSRARAEQTNVWHISNDVPTVQPAQVPRYDFEQIRAYMREIEAHNKAWNDWFRINGVLPHSVWYEDLTAAPVQTTHAILDFLKLDVPLQGRITASNKRLADGISNEWIARYQAELKTRF